MSVSGSKIHERVAHFFIDIYNALYSDDGTELQQFWHSSYYINGEYKGKYYGTWEYDSNNNLLSYTVYNEAGEITEKTEYTYDSEGNVLTEYEDRGLGICESEYSYDSNGNVISYIQYYNSDLEHITKYLYNDSGLLIQQTSTTYSDDGEETTESFFEYDENGNLVKESDTDGTYTEYVYDTYGNLLTESASDGTVTEYTYDENGNMLTDRRIDPDGTVKRRTEYVVLEVPVQ
jgi:YD repeat-containing protein